MHNLLYSGKLSAPWQWYFMMQHYGLPTRLVDWSESPLVALYFAVKSTVDSIESTNSERPCVWCLEPNRFNLLSVDYDGIITPGGEFASHWMYQTDPTEEQGCLPGCEKPFMHNRVTYSNKLPLAIFPIRSNRRILAQQGVFTVHGADTRGIQEITNYKTGKNTSENDILFRIDIQKSSCKKILQELSFLKVHELALFPELPQLSTSLLARANVESGLERKFSKKKASIKKKGKKKKSKKRTSRKKIGKKKSRRV